MFKSADPTFAYIKPILKELSSSQLLEELILDIHLYLQTPNPHLVNYLKPGYGLTNDIEQLIFATAQMASAEDH